MFDRHFLCLFCLLFTGICHLPYVLTVRPKSVLTLRYTRWHGPLSLSLSLYIYIYTGPCSKALIECSPLDFRRSSIVSGIIRAWTRTLKSKAEKQRSVRQLTACTVIATPCHCSRLLDFLFSFLFYIDFFSLFSLSLSLI